MEAAMLSQRWLCRLVAYEECNLERLLLALGLVAYVVSL